MCHTDIRKYFSGLSLMQNQREAHVLLGWGRWENLDMFLLGKGNFIMINKFRYGQIWKIWPSPISLSLYSTFNPIGHSPQIWTLFLAELIKVLW